MDLLLIAIFSLAVFYHGVSSRQSPKRVGQHAGEAADDARQEDIELGVANPAGYVAAVPRWPRRVMAM